MTDKPRIRQTADGNMVPVFDGLQNVVSGLSTRADKRSFNQFVFGGNFFNYTELEAAYATNWIARQIVQIPVDDAFREWREFQCEDAADIRKEEKRLDLPNKFKQSQYWSRLYGGSAILMVTDQPIDQPLDVTKIGKGGLKRLVVLDRWEIAPFNVNYSDPTAANYLMPEFYTIRGGSGQIHHTHLVRIDGEDLPRRIRAYNETWGDSRLRQCLEDLKDVTSVKSGIAAMVQEANIDVINRQELSAELASDQDAEIMKRYSVGAQMKSLMNILLLDGTETYERKQLAFSGLNGILDSLYVWTSGCADIPMTRLFGQSPAGMNATGESDLRNYYDSVGSAQESRYRPQLERLDEAMIRSALGKIPEDCEWEWSPLYQESGTELAQQELAAAQSEDLRLNQGVILPSHIMLRMKNEGRYAITDEEIQRQQEQEQAEREGLFDPDPGVEDPSDPQAQVMADPALESIDPDSSLNGAQVTAMLDVVNRVRSGELTRPTAIRIMATAFPLSEERAAEILSEVQEREITPEEAGQRDD